MTNVTQGRGRDLGGQLVGRDAELSVLRDFLMSGVGARAVILAGPPGIGKTTLFDRLTGIACDGGYRVLATGASRAVAPTPFAALIDLCDGVEGDDLVDLPEPQRHALEVALLRERPGQIPPSARAIALGFRAVIRKISAAGPTLVAVDDAQWLDTPSLEVLTFLAQRLGRESICFLVTRSSERPTTMESSFDRIDLRRCDIGPLSFGAVRRLLFDRLGLSLSRSLLRSIVNRTGANPLFALELGREILARDDRADPRVLPIPARLEDLLEGRIGALPPAPRRALMVLALCPDIDFDALTAVTGRAALDEVVDLGLVRLERRRIRTSHPLLGPAALRGVGQRSVRELHAAIADALANPEQSAMHQALATLDSSGPVSATVAEAAAGAASRGARQQAVALAEHALRITPIQSAHRAERVIALAECLETAGETQRLTDHLTAEWDSLPSGGPKAMALFLLSEGATPQSLDDQTELRRRALAEAPNDTPLRARVLAKEACDGAASRISNIKAAEQRAVEAVTLTRGASLPEHRLSLYALAWARAMSGRHVDHECRASGATADVNAYVAVTPERVACQRLVWRGEIAQARESLTELLALADDRGENESYALVRLHMCELHLRVGEWAAAEELLTEWAESDRNLMYRPKYERCRALLAAGRGDLAETREWAALAVARARETGCRWDEFEGLRADAMGSLLAHMPAAAAACLLPVWTALEAEGVDEPGVFPIAPELVQALVESDDITGAKMVVDRLTRFSARGAHPWAAATVDRCRGMVALTGPDSHAAATWLAAAGDAYLAVGLRFDAARCWVSLGRGQRRRRQWGAARAALELAVVEFDALASPGWAEHARNELELLGTGRSTTDGQLTPAEERAAARAAAGLSNKEIARELVVSVHTVEVHLSRVYAKLGVRSRGQLAARLRDVDALQH